MTKSGTNWRTAIRSTSASSTAARARRAFRDTIFENEASARLRTSRVERRLAPVPAVARLVEREAAMGQGAVDLDGPGQDGRAVLDDGDRALPVLDAALRIVLRLELVEAEAEGGLRDVGRLAFDEGQVRAAPAEAAGQAAGEDDEQTEMDDIGAEPGPGAVFRASRTIPPASAGVSVPVAARRGGRRRSCPWPRRAGGRGGTGP